MSDPRCPNFFILGAAKAGTTTLYDVLRQHPDIFLTFVKEPQFFSNDSLYAQGFEHYLATHFAGSEAYPARGEATPHYLCFEKVARRIARDVPAANQRFIVVLRDPVRRAYSLYWNMVSEGVEPLDFEAAIAREHARTADRQLEAEGSLRYRYVESGLYARQIEAYLRHFSLDRFHFVWFEDLVADPAAVAAELCAFLGVRADVALDTSRKSNASNRPRSRWLHRWVRHPNVIKSMLKPIISRRLRYRLTSGLVEMNRKTVSNPPLDRAVEARLREFFDADVRALERLTGRDLSVWRESRVEAAP